jgi:hypothetical protein
VILPRLLFCFAYCILTVTLRPWGRTTTNKKGKTVMAAVPITIVGTITGKSAKEGDASATEQVVIQGIASLTGLEVGGGPMPGGPPLGFWGGRPPPFVDIGFPQPQPHPEHPIVLPPELPPELPPPDGRPIDWKVAWTPVTGWIVVGVPTGPHPAPSRRND